MAYKKNIKEVRDRSLSKPGLGGDSDWNLEDYNTGRSEDSEPTLLKTFDMKIGTPLEIEQRNIHVTYLLKKNLAALSWNLGETEFKDN